MNVGDTHYKTVWMEGSTVRMIDQPKLPHTFQIADMLSVEETAHAIKSMVVRGAGAIGATGAYGMAQAAILADPHSFHESIQQAKTLLENTRPTAQNLFYGINSVLKAIESSSTTTEAISRAIQAAQAVADEDVESCRLIGQYGAAIIEPNMTISTHCNAGWLAFVDWGSALSPVYHAHRQGKTPFVFVDETRPRGQGARAACGERL